MGKGTLGVVVVDDPSGPVYTMAGHLDVVAGFGQKGSKACRFCLTACPLNVTGSNTHCDIVKGAFVIVLVQLPSLTVTRG